MHRKASVTSPVPDRQLQPSEGMMGAAYLQDAANTVVWTCLLPQCMFNTRHQGRTTCKMISLHACQPTDVNYKYLWRLYKRVLPQTHSQRVRVGAASSKHRYVLMPDLKLMCHVYDTVLILYCTVPSHTCTRCSDVKY